MDDYQKHLERQLQQQHGQLRTSAGPDLAGGRLGTQPPLLAAATTTTRPIPGQPPQWTANMNSSGVGPTPQGNVPGYGRGLAPNPMGINAAASAHLATPQSLQTPSPVNAFAPGPQGTPQNAAPGPRTKNQTSPPPPISPITGDPYSEKKRIATILEINSLLIKICLELQSTVSPENIPQDAAYSGCVMRLQQNLAYLAAIADRAHKPEIQQKPLPHIQVLTAPPLSRAHEEKEALDRLYKVLASLQPNSESVNGDASGSDSGSQVNSPQVRSRQTSAGSSQPSQGPQPQQQPPPPQQQHVPTPQMQRSHLPGHAQHNTPSPHMTANSVHGQSNLNPNHPQGIRPQPQAPPQQSFPQNPFAMNQNQQFQQMAQQPQFQQQIQQLQQQSANQPYNPQNPSMPLGMQAQFQQFQQSPQSFQQQAQPQQQQPPHLQPRAPSRPPSRPTSQHSATGPSPSISPRPLPPGPSPQLSSTPTPGNSASPRMPMPNMPPDLTPEQQAIFQERMRLARDARIQQIQQQANRGPINPNIFPMSNGIPQQHGFPAFPNPTMMNGTQNQNFGAGGGGE